MSKESSNHFQEMGKRQNEYPDIEVRQYLKEAVKGASFTGGGSLISKYLLGPIAAVILTRILGPEDYGVYILTMQVFSILTIFTTLGLTKGNVKFIPEYRTRNQEKMISGTIWNSVKIAILASFIIGVLVLNLSGFISDLFNEPKIRYPLMFAMIALPIVSAKSVFASALQGFKRLDYRAISENVVGPSARVLTLILLLLILGFGLYGAIGAFLAKVIASCGVAIFFLMRVFPKIKSKFEDKSWDPKRIFNFSIPLFLKSAFSLSTQRIDILMLGAFSTSYATGLYGAALKFVPFIYLPLQAVNAAFQPMISELYSKKDIAQLEKLFKTLTKWILTISFPMFLILSLFGTKLLLVFGKEFPQSYLPMIILSAGMLINTSVGSVGNIVMMIGKSRVNLYNSIAFAAMNVVFNALLIPKFGLIGAAIGTTSSIILINLARLVEVFHFLKIHPYKLSFLKTLCSGGISWLIVFALKSVLPLPYFQISFILYVAFFIGLYIGLLYFFRLDEEDKYMLEILLRKVKIGLTFMK